MLSKNNMKKHFTIGLLRQNSSRLIKDQVLQT